MPRNPAKVACRICHDRRVRCDRSEGVACSNCRNARRHCEPIVSRRGRRRRLPLFPSTATSRILPEIPHNVPERVMTSTYAEGSDKRKKPGFPAPGSSGKTPYVGDASNLNYLLEQFGNPFEGADVRPLQDHLHGAMLARTSGVFDLPSPAISQKLLNTYFHYSLAALPILDQSRFLVTLEKGSFSHLLLNAIYLVATIYCSDFVISEAGFPSRYAASLTFYQRAKDLYDAGHETDTIATIQATLLMCHWWSGLLDHKDSWYWLGISAGMAVALGMHQVKSYIRLESNEQSLWRKLWWMIYAMDINLSMLLDRPPHVQGRLCNVPSLSDADFKQTDGSKSTETVNRTLSEANVFAINIAQLAQIVDRFFTLKFEEDGDSQDICLDQISLWSSSLPLELRAVSTNSSKWTILTQILYQEYRLILHRSNPRFSHNTGPGTPTYEICTEISHILEIVMANDLVYPAAASIISPVLSVLPIHIVNIYKGDPGVRMISEHRARFCMMILDKLQDRLPVVAAFLPLYEALLKRAGVQTRNGTNLSVCPATGSLMQDCLRRPDQESDLGGPDPPEGSFDQVLQDSLSSTLPFSFPFGNLFEDIFLSSPPRSTSFCDDNMAVP